MLLTKNNQKIEISAKPAKKKGYAFEYILKAYHCYHLLTMNKYVKTVEKLEKRGFHEV